MARRRRKMKPQKIVLLVAVSMAIIVSLSYPFLRTQLASDEVFKCVVTSVGEPNGVVADRWKMKVFTKACGEFYTTIDSPYAKDGSFDFNSWSIKSGSSYDFAVEGFSWEPSPEIITVKKVK